MDSDRFDRLSRALSVVLTRRTSLGLATLMGLGSLADTGAKKRKKRKKKPNCPAGYTACGKQCFDLSDNVNHCGSCATVCSPGKTCCQGTCVDLLDDDGNCAKCGNRCLTTEAETPRIDAAQICQAGVCVECSIEGKIRQTNLSLPCCRGLKRCTGDATGTPPDNCKPVDQAC